MHIGNKHIHVSHKLYRYRGLIFCQRCGNITQGDMAKSLVNKCGPAKAYGSRNLAAIRGGRIPPKVKEWPIQAHAIQPNPQPLVSPLTQEESTAIQGVYMGIIRVREEEEPPNKRARRIPPNDPVPLIPLMDIEASPSSRPNEANAELVPSSSNTEGDGSSSD